MRAFVVVVMQPFIQIGLQRVDAVIKFLAERHSQQYGRGMVRSIGETQLRLSRSYTVTRLNSICLY